MPLSTKCRVDLISGQLFLSSDNMKVKVDNPSHGEPSLKVISFWRVATVLNILGVGVFLLPSSEPFIFIRLSRKSQKHPEHFCVHLGCYLSPWSDIWPSTEAIFYLCQTLDYCKLSMYCLTPMEVLKQKSHHAQDLRFFSLNCPELNVVPFWNLW